VAVRATAAARARSLRVGLDETDQRNEAHVSATARNSQEPEDSGAPHVSRQGPGLEPNRITDRVPDRPRTWVVQGWTVTDLDALSQMSIPDGETAVEIPDRMIPFFGQEGCDPRNG
jgi:hypothetical protein